MNIYPYSVGSESRPVTQLLLLVTARVVLYIRKWKKCCVRELLSPARRALRGQILSPGDFWAGRHECCAASKLRVMPFSSPSSSLEPSRIILWGSWSTSLCRRAGSGFSGGSVRVTQTPYQAYGSPRPIGNGLRASVWTHVAGAEVQRAVHRTQLLHSSCPLTH